MNHIDTLQVYQDYLKSGYTDEQATCAVKSLNASFDSVATKDDINRLRWLILGVGSICAIPIVQDWVISWLHK